MAATVIDSLDAFNTLCVIKLLSSVCDFPRLASVARFGIALALKRAAMLGINGEAVMWKITTRGFTLEEVLVMAAMNLLLSNAAAPKRQKHGRKIKRRTKMFKRILVAFDGSPESRRALAAGAQLAKSLKADLTAVYVYEKEPPYAEGYMNFGVPGASIVLPEQAAEYYRMLHVDAEQIARQQGVALKTKFVEGDEVQAIAEYVQKTQSDLLVLGIHHHNGLFSRLWNHTTQDLSQRVLSSVLGIH